MINDVEQISLNASNSVGTRTDTAPQTGNAGHMGGAVAAAPSDSPEGDSGAGSLTQYCTSQLAEAKRRHGVLQAFNQLVADGCSKKAAAKQLKESQATLWRWQQAYGQDGFDGLIPDTHLRGRKSVTKKLGFEGELRKVARQIRLRTGSDALTLAMIKDAPECPEALHNFINEMSSRHRIPPSVRRELHLTDHIENKHRGPRTYQLNAFTTLRDMTEVLADGTRVQIQPGDWWEMDDMSFNQPFVYENKYGTDKLAQKFQVGIGRQSLHAMDIASGKWLGFELIGRPRDSYRAEDILRFVRKLIQQWGLPRRGIRLERSIWKSKRITGFLLGADDRISEQELVRDEMEAKEQEKLWGGLAELGLEVEYVYTPGQKGFIEAGFNYFQSVMGVVNATNIGRFRGEFERATKHLIAAHAGSKNPRLKGFIDINALADRACAAQVWMNGESKEGRLQQGVPDEKWATSLTASPLKALDPQKLWIFLPETRERKIDRGHVAPHITGIGPIPFCAPELFAELGNGYSLLVRFDPSEPQLGAALFNNETGRRNIHNWRVGEFIGWAQFADFAPQFAATAGFEDANRDLRKRFNNFNASAFRAIGVYGQKAAKTAEMRDGRGGVAKVTQNAGEAVPAAATEMREARTAETPFGRIKKPTQEERQQRRNRTATQATIANQLRDTINA